MLLFHGYLYVERDDCKTDTFFVKIKMNDNTFFCFLLKLIILAFFMIIYLDALYSIVLGTSAVLLDVIRAYSIFFSIVCDTHN